MSLLEFAENPHAYVALGADEERIEHEAFCIRFSPGEHFWSTGVQRVRFDDVEAGLEQVRTLMRERRRSSAAWTIGPSATPPDVAERLLALGLERSTGDPSTILILQEPPASKPSPFTTRIVSTLDEHLAALEVQIAGFGYRTHDAEDERRRARETFASEQQSGHVVRMLVLDGARAIATGVAWPSPHGLYVGGGCTIPTDRNRGALYALVGAAWREAVRRGTPALVSFGGEMSAPGLVKMGFRAHGQVRHLVDRLP